MRRILRKISIAFCDAYFKGRGLDAPSNDSTMRELLNKLKNHWAQAGLRLNVGTSESQIKEFEDRNQIKLPSSLREYFLELNGLPDFELDGLTRLWPFENIYRLSDLFVTENANDWLPSDATSYFIFGDYNIEGSHWAIKLTNTEATGHSIIVVYACVESYKEVADSFEIFLNQYIEAMPESLI